MKNPFAGLKKKQVKLQFSTCGEIMIDGLPFAFGVESAGKASDKGLCVSISGEAVNDGRVTFSNLEYYENHGGKITLVKHGFSLVTKRTARKFIRRSLPKYLSPKRTHQCFSESSPRKRSSNGSTAR